MWYENSFRRHLLDMHINDWGDGVFLSKFSAEEYLKNLLTAKVDCAMIYLQSHVGYCYYPTAVGHIHPAFAARPYEIKKLIDGCHAHGIKVVAYYSLIYNRVENNAHPDWQLYGSEDEKREFSGKRYLHCCPNSEEYLDFTLRQIKEIFDYADYEGIFFDMPFWPKVCRCKNCAARYEKEHGGKIPENVNAPGFREFAEIRDGWLNEFLKKITDYCKSVRPEVTVEFNLAQAVLPGELMPGEGVAALTDYASGDLYRGAFSHSFACKLYSAITHAEPFECMTSRCPNLKAHTLTRSRSSLRTSLLTVCAHHGANFVIDAIDPVGTMDARFYKKLGDLYGETKKYEKYMKKGKPVADVGLFFCLEGKYSTEKEPYLHYEATINTAKTLAAAHIPYGVVTQATTDRLPLFKTVVLAGVTGLNKDTVTALCDYVKNGGNLYFSGAADSELLKTVAKYEGQTDCGYSYVAPGKGAKKFFAEFTEKYPVPVAYNLPKVTTGYEVLAHIVLPYIKEGSFSSIHSNPPGVATEYPALIRRRLGKGTIIWSAACFESEKSRYVSDVFVSIISKLCGGFMIETNAPSQVEAVIFSTGRQTLVSFIYQSDDEDVPPVSEFSVSLACAHPVGSITDITDKKQIPFVTQGEKTVFNLSLPDGFKMIKLS